MHDDDLHKSAQQNKWSCEGRYEGATVFCQKGIAVNGACSGYKDTCSKGTWADGTDTGTHYKWSCSGVHGGSTVQCQSAIVNNGNTPTPVNGACNSLVANACSAGSFTDVSDTTSKYKWQCIGMDGGTDASCQLSKPVNGTCGTTKNTCTNNTTLEDVVDNDTYYLWYCHGKHGGRTSSCSKAMPVNGGCDNTKQNGCTAGTANDSAVANTTTYYKWWCVGSHGGTTVKTCQYNKPINGTCSTTTKDTCTAGTKRDEVDNLTHYQWRCLGQYGGADSDICTKVIPVNGVCNNTKRNGCSKGTTNDAAVTDDSTYYKWRCDGVNSGNNSNTCQYNKPVSGACGAVKDACTSGTMQDVVDTSFYYVWSCIGSYGGAIRFCHINKPEAGVCGAIRNTCHRGNYVAGTNTNTTYKWSCNGRYGSSSNASCSLPKTQTFSAPNKPTGVQGMLVFPDFVVSWLAPQDTGGFGIMGYEVQWHSGSSAPSVWPSYRVDNSACESGRRLWCKVSRRYEGVDGYIRVRAFSTMGEGDWSSDIKVGWRSLVVNFGQLSSGGYHTCALTSLGGVKCWGSGGNGRLGNKSTTDQTTPVDVHSSSVDSTPLSGVVQLSAGSSHTCALTSLGGVKCWGYGASGQVGNKSTTDQTTPVDVHSSSVDSTPLSGVVQLSAGYSHTCALTSLGGVKCWGYGDYGRLGNKSTTDQTTPVDVHSSSGDSTPLSGVVQLSAGSSHTCALTSLGGVKCWGRGDYGQVGNKSTTSQTTPVDVHSSSGDSTPLSGVVQLSAGSSHTCALTSLGGVKCWGRGDYGQVGNKSTTSQTTPVDVHSSSGDSTPLSGVGAVIGRLLSHLCVDESWRGEVLG